MDDDMYSGGSDLGCVERAARIASTVRHNSTSCRQEMNVQLGACLSVLCCCGAWHSATADIFNIAVVRQACMLYARSAVPSLCQAGTVPADILILRARLPRAAIACSQMNATEHVALHRCYTSMV